MRRSTLFALALSLSGCGNGTPPSPYKQKLSDYGLFTAPLASLQPVAGVVPYEVNAILYADGAGKSRFLAIPKGKQIHFDPSGRWTFPAGTALVKTFAYDHDARHPELGRTLLETRLLLLGDDGVWSAVTYEWNEGQTDADLAVAGDTLSVARIDDGGAQISGEYRVPNLTQCKSCHGQNKVIVPLGPRTRQLNRTHDFGAGLENQLTHFATLNLFDGALPDPAGLERLADPLGTAPVADRARAYLDANCAHCHNEEGYASSTALRLNIETTTPVDLGECRHPVAAGHANGGFLFDVVPGHPEQSIMVFRVQSNDPEIKMPQLPLTTSDPVGVDLITKWISGMSPAGCP